ncbi:hypothetical protein AX16_008619 [Volvariella volvacea WC 439]|nr:hypothetical protein AX16_008619 [Volvariella volvacea WC 439]
MDGPGYVNILQESYLGTLKDFGMKCSGKTILIFQQDNNLKHTSGVVKAWFEKKKLNAHICAHNTLSRNKEEFWEALQEEWYLFPQEALNKLYKSMPCPVASLLVAQGGHTKY